MAGDPAPLPVSWHTTKSSFWGPAYVNVLQGLGINLHSFRNLQVKFHKRNLVHMHSISCMSATVSHFVRSPICKHIANALNNNHVVYTDPHARRTRRIISMKECSGQRLGQAEGKGRRNQEFHTCSVSPVVEVGGRRTENPPLDPGRVEIFC